MKSIRSAQKRESTDWWSLDDAQQLAGAAAGLRGGALALLLARALEDVALDLEERVDDLVLHELTRV